MSIGLMYMPVYSKYMIIHVYRGNGGISHIRPMSRYNQTFVFYLDINA